MFERQKTAAKVHALATVLSIPWWGIIMVVAVLTSTDQGGPFRGAAWYVAAGAAIVCGPLTYLVVELMFVPLVRAMAGIFTSETWLAWFIGLPLLVFRIFTVPPQWVAAQMLDGPPALHDDPAPSRHAGLDGRVQANGPMTFDGREFNEGNMVFRVRQDGTVDMLDHPGWGFVTSGGAIHRGRRTGRPGNEPTAVILADEGLVYFEGEPSGRWVPA